MGMFTFEVYVNARKGLGPEWVEKHLSITLDDIEPGTSSGELLDMVRREVAQEMRGFTYEVLEIEEA